MRSEEELEAAEQEWSDRMWYARHKTNEARYQRIVSGEETHPTTPVEIAKRALASGERMRVQYGGEDNLLPANDTEWGEYLGKVSALRWALGYEWDSLDS